MEILYRKASVADAQDVHDIYQYYVDHTAVTFRTVNLNVVEYAEKIGHTAYPFLIAEAEGRAVGFAYAERLRPHDAYLWDVELTIYLHPDAPKRTGMGSRLYENLLKILAEQGFRNAYGVITGSNQSSIEFHERFGFVKVACFPKMGYKHGAWHDVVWMNKTLGDFEGKPEIPEPFRKA